MSKAGDQRRRGIAMGCVFAMLSIALHMVVDMPLQIPANAVAMCLVISLALLAATNGRSRVRSEESVENSNVQAIGAFE
jgi:hypothetical protein